MLPDHYDSSLSSGQAHSYERMETGAFGISAGCVLYLSGRAVFSTLQGRAYSLQLSDSAYETGEKEYSFFCRAPALNIIIFSRVLLSPCPAFPRISLSAP